TDRGSTGPDWWSDGQTLVQLVTTEETSGDCSLIPPDCEKYPRMPHLPWSPGGTRDDRRLTSVEPLLHRPRIVSEKLDGSNICLTRDRLFARSHSGPPSHPSFDYAKALHSRLRARIDPDLSLFGEYCYAVHTIRYDALPAYLFLFAVRADATATWAAWDTVAQTAARLDLPTVPVLWRGSLSSAAELQSLTERLMSEPSAYGPEREGIVVRLAGE